MMAHQDFRSKITLARGPDHSQLWLIELSEELQREVENTEATLDPAIQLKSPKELNIRKHKHLGPDKKKSRDAITRHERKSYLERFAICTVDKAYPVYEDPSPHTLMSLTIRQTPAPKPAECNTIAVLKSIPKLVILRTQPSGGWKAADHKRFSTYSIQNFLLRVAPILDPKWALAGRTSQLSAIKLNTDGTVVSTAGMRAKLYADIPRPDLECELAFCAIGGYFDGHGSAFRPPVTLLLDMWQSVFRHFDVTQSLSMPELRDRACSKVRDRAFSKVAYLEILRSVLKYLSSSLKTLAMDLDLSVAATRNIDRKTTVKWVGEVYFGTFCAVTSEKDMPPDVTLDNWRELLPTAWSDDVTLELFGDLNWDQFKPTSEALVRARGR